MLTKLNSHATGFAGLAIGGGSIIAAVAAFFHLLSDPSYLAALFVAVQHARMHAMTSVDIQTFAQIAGAAIATLGAAVCSLLLAYFGKPTTINDSVAQATPDGLPAPKPGP